VICTLILSVPHLPALAAASSTTHLSIVQVVVLALLQGVAELFPISSLGHTVIAPKLLGWHIDQSADSFLPFVVALHLGTGIALVVYFRRDWVAIITPMVRSVQRGRLSDDPTERIGWLVAVGTIPAAILGVLLEKPVKSLFANPEYAAAFLIVNGFVLYLGERLRLRAQAYPAAAAAGAGGMRVALDAPAGDLDARPARPITTLGWGEAAIIGAAQALAFLPGISRSGVTMVAGLASGLNHEAAARFSFLLATPVILAAAALEIPTLFGSSGRDLLGDAVLAVCWQGSPPT
jgi:undecaprenyl-diphosphatase